MSSTRRDFLKTLTTIVLAPSSLEALAEEKPKHTFEDYVNALIKIESGGNPKAVRYEPQRKDYSYGLGQILTNTAKDVRRHHPELPKLGTTPQEIRESLFNPKINITYTSTILKEELDFYSNPELAIAAYNSGHLTPRNARIQEQLNDIYKTNLNTDGKIGKKSKQIVKRFQEEYGLDTDGIVGPNTYKKIQNIWEGKFPNMENPKGIVPDLKYTTNHVKKFRKALDEI